MKRYYRYLGGIFIAMLATYMLLSTADTGLDASATGYAAYEGQEEAGGFEPRPIQDVAKELEEMGFQRTRPERAYVEG